MAALCVSPESYKNWEKSGKHEFVKLCKSLAENNGLWKQGTKTIHRALSELSWLVIRDSLKPEQAVTAFADVSDHYRDTLSVLADVLAVIDVETQCSEKKSERDRFIALAAACVSLIPEPVLKERFDQELLETIGVIQSRLTFQQKYVKTKTRLYYKQQKFNLLREENEGYAKLVTELNQKITDRISHTHILETIKSLIGRFDLDPNRILDILLESFENHPECESFYVSLFKEYVSEPMTLCQVLGFKFTFYKGEETPLSLYRVAALLLKNNLLALDALYPHLAPTDESIIEYHKREMNAAKEKARRLNIMVLSDKEDKKEDENAKFDLDDNNQKLGLCEALLNIAAWVHAKAMMDRMPEFFTTTHKPVATALCALIHAMIDPLYRQNSGLSAALVRSKSCGKEKLTPSINRVRTFRELNDSVFPMFSYLGPYAACDPVLLIKFIRMGKSFFSKRHNGGILPEDDIAYFGFLNMLDDVIVPSLSFLPCNCCHSEELWGLLKLLPYELRYRLYGNWKNETYAYHAKMIRVRAECLEKAKYIMKRLSKENVKPSGRQLGKLSHSNPGVVFEYVLSQIQRYDNFIGPVVDSLKYLTSLSYDILIYCIIEAVANPDKDRMKHDDTNISLWLQSLANFAGSICKKYQVELAGLMQYVGNQLKASKSFDLLLLREVVQKMAGIEVSEEVTNDQLDAMSGGELLRQEGGYFAQVRNTKKSSTRLKETLLEHDLALSLCLLMPQQRDGVIFQEGVNRHLKLIGKLYDQCQDTFVQFGSFLSMQLSTEEFVKRLPAIDTLVSSYHVPPDAAFFLSRSRYSYAINSKYEELRKDKSKTSKQSSSQLKTQKYIEASEMVMAPVVDLVQPLYAPKVWEDLSASFYVTFWSLSMYDLEVPSTAYEKQKQQLSLAVTTVEENRDLPQSRKKREKERCNSLIDKLKDEEKKQGEHTQRVLARLKQAKDSWFISRSTKNDTVTQFLQLCIFPRCCFTANDALFCAKFIHILHNLKTPNFSTLICYDRIFCDITYTVTSCTENEAHRYGRFLCAALQTIMRWHSHKNIYEKECANYPGFVTVFRKGADSNNKADQLDFENYRHVCHKWHFRITKAMVSCLESGNYIQIRNALIVLTKIISHYPRIMQFGQALERRVDRLRQEEKDKRPDIYALAIGYSGQLKMRKPTWVPESEFHMKDKDGAKAQQSKSSTSNNSKSDTHQSSSKENIAKKSDVKKSDLETKHAAGKHTDGVLSKSSNKNKEGRDKEKKFSREAKEETRNKDSTGTEGQQSSSKRPKEKKARNEDKIYKDKSEDVPREKGQERESRKEKLDKSYVWEEKVPREKTPKEKNREDKVRKDDHQDDHWREEKHEKIKLKRSLSPERERVERADREYRERASSITSSGSFGSHHPSPEQSPRQHDERDTKRRKMDGIASKSPSYEKERDRERKEKKRDHSTERNGTENKKWKTEPSTSHSSSKINGDTDTHHHGHREGERTIKSSKKESKTGAVSPVKIKSRDKDREKSKKSEKDKEKTRDKIKKIKK
ncbi:hypothetical protein ScPMuIL_010120 [Solemya velum]